MESNGLGYLCCIIGIICSVGSIISNITSKGYTGKVDKSGIKLNKISELDKRVSELDKKIKERDLIIQKLKKELVTIKSKMLKEKSTTQIVTQIKKKLVK